MLNINRITWIQHPEQLDGAMRPWRKGITSALLVLPFLFACAEETSFTEEDQDRLSKEAAAFLDDYHRAIEAGGLEAEVDYLDNSEDFFWVPPGYHSALSYDSVMAILSQNAPSIQSLKYEWEYIDIYPLSETIVNYTGKLQNQVTDTAGNVSSFTMLETGTLIKREMGWKILHGQSRILDTEEIVF